MQAPCAQHAGYSQATAARTHVEAVACECRPRSKGRGSIRGDCCAQAADRLRGAYGAPEGSFKLGAQSLSNMVYAYAVLGHHPGVELLSAIAKGVQWQLRDFSPQVCT